MNVEFSQQANLYLDEYKNALVEQYGRSEERANELKQQMEGEIRAKAFNANGLPVCQYTKLGQKKDAKGNCLNQNLRFLQYMSKSTKSTWGVSVICDMEHDIATVHRILHSSYITESSSKWILLKEFVNRNTMRNKIMKMKRIRFNESTDDMAELRKYLDDFADATIEASKKDFDDPKCNQSIESTRTNVIDYVMGLGLSYDRVASRELDDVYYAAFNFATRPTENFRKSLEDSKILFLHLIKHSLRNEEN